MNLGSPAGFGDLTSFSVEKAFGLAKWKKMDWKGLGGELETQSHSAGEVGLREPCRFEVQRVAGMMIEGKVKFRARCEVRQ